MHQCLALNPESYQPHRIHTQERDWAETNCYVDVWIELLHALGHEPIAAMPYTLAIDFEGDQWTFFKFPLADLYDLYGIDVQELAIWQPLVNHIEQQVALGKPVLVELDSYCLPDTVGTAYKQAHVKTTVAIVEIDVERQHLGYFHGQGYYHLSGDDFIDVFRLRSVSDPSILEPYVEIAKLRSNAQLSTNQTLQLSLQLIKKHLKLLPSTNPFPVFKTRFEADLSWLMGQSIETFHQYSFATFRQFGACYELAANYLDWLASQGETDIVDARDNIKSISETAKAYQFQLARAMSRKKPLDLKSIDLMGRCWELAMDKLKQKYL